MYKLQKLEDMVYELKVALDNKTNKKTDDIVPILQKIGAELLTKYEIRIGNITIEPLRIEAYLFKETVFEDKFIHHIKKNKQSYYGPQQRNKFGKLYIHSGYTGVDIVLSNDDNYAFSFLIKNSRVLISNNVAYPFLKQNGVAKVLKDSGIPVDYGKIVLYKKEVPSNSTVFKSIRNGLRNIIEREDFKKTEQNKYNQLLISSFIELNEHTSSQYDFERGYGKEWMVANYMFENNIPETDENIKELLGYKSQNVKNIIKEMH